MKIDFYCITCYTNFMILNDARIVFIHPSNVGGSIIRDNLSHEHKKDLYNSFYAPHNKYIKINDKYKSYFNTKGATYPVHASRYYFDDCFLGNRKDFFYFTMVRNPWCQSLSFAKFVIQNYYQDIAFTLDNKVFINDIIYYIYVKKFYKSLIVNRNISEHISSTNNILDYDYIVYFENIVNDLDTMSTISGLKFNSQLHIKYKPIDYREYLTQQSINMITKFRKIDIELFGYDFEKGVVFRNNQPKINNKCKTKYKVRRQSL